MTLYLILKAAHIVGATALLGTGAGIAFFMLMAHRTGDARLIAHTAGVVVIADMIFSAAADAPLPLAYYRLWRLWFAFGFPAFAMVIAIIWLMVAKPTF